MNTPYLRLSAICLLLVVSLTELGTGRTRSPNVQVTDDPRTEIPEAATCEAKLGILHEVYSKEYADRSDAGRRSLATLLLAESQGVSDDEDRYVLLNEALDLATKSHDLNTSLVAIDSLARMYRVDPIPMECATIKSVSRALPEGMRESFSREALSRIDAYILNGDFTTAETLASSVRAAIRKVEDPLLQERYQAHVAAINHYALYSKALEALAENPENEEAHLTVGLYIATTDGSLDSAFQHLEHASDDQLRSLARLELSPEEDRASRNLADEWNRLVKTRSGQARALACARASYWYESLLPDLADLERRQVEHRLSEIEALFEPTRPPVPDAPHAPRNLVGYRGRVGESLFFTVVGSTTGSIWGTDLYTDDSNLATAAVHAGLLEPGEQGVLEVLIEAGHSSYSGSERHGVASRPWKSFEGSYRLRGRRLTVVREAGASLANSHDRQPEIARMAWAEILTERADPKVVTESGLRRSIDRSGLPWRVRHRSTGVEMLLVPIDEEEGGFFYLGRYELQESEWAHVVQGAGLAEDKGLPVFVLSMRKAEDFLSTISDPGLRLPTEREWEIACRAGNAANRYGSLSSIAWYAGNSGTAVHDVGLKEPNALGFYDMIGNVNEWCAEGVMRGGSYRLREDFAVVDRSIVPKNKVSAAGLRLAHDAQ